MKQFCAVVLLLVAVAAQRNENVTTLEELYASDDSLTRIINGLEATTGQFPWQVSVIFYTSRGPAYCGGSLIHQSWVLTAAHCAQGAQYFRLRIGGTSLNQPESGKVDVRATRHYVHPGYSASSLNNDIALIQLDNPIQLSRQIKTVKLPARGHFIGVSQKVTVSGWGKVSDSASGPNGKLRYVDLTTIDNSRCRSVYGSNVVTQSTLCCLGSNKKSTCNGDSGGPLVQIDSSGATQVGVVSFVHPSGCASGQPSGYIRTESYLSWIHQITGVVGA